MKEEILEGGLMHIHSFRQLELLNLDLEQIHPEFEKPKSEDLK